MPDRPRDLTYPEVGATLEPTLPRGYRHADVRRQVAGPDDPAAFEQLAEAVRHWALQEAAGMTVPDGPVTDGEAYDLHLGPVPVPVRVVALVEEPDRRGFVYGTRAGHPVRGEEAFFAERDAEGTWVHVRAFSRPGRWYTRLAGPLAQVGQLFLTERYLRGAVRAVER